MSGLFGQTVSPQGPTNIFNQSMSQGGSVQEQSFLNALFDTTVSRQADGQWNRFIGLPGYDKPVSPDMGQTILPNVYSNWQPWNAGTGYLANYVGGPQAGKPDPGMATAFSNMSQYGGIGGYPTQLMHNAAQYGGTGGPGNKAMSNLLQFGAPSAAGQAVNNMAQYGVSGSWGNPLLARATGGQSPAGQYLAPFLAGASPYRANWRQG
jgi:hypothetical protein